MISLFLSASIPLPHRDPKYLATADVIAIRESIKALVGEALTQAEIVFGGHPAITPLIAILMRGMPIETRKRAILYLSDFFKDDFVSENDEFIELHVVAKTEGDINDSLLRMRREMIGSHKFDAAIFIGGMEGIWTEYHMFREIHPTALCFPIGSTGAAALELFKEIALDQPNLLDELSYPVLFRQILQQIKIHKADS